MSGESRIRRAQLCPRVLFISHKGRPTWRPNNEENDMIRKLILSAVIATATITCTSLSATTAEAAHPGSFKRDRYRHGVRFEVQVRHVGHWDTYGTYHHREEARRVVTMLERQGRDAKIEVERSRW